jgi:hypothetical protein
VNYSSEKTPLKSTLHFYPKYKNGNETEHNFQRRLALHTRELQDEEFAKSLEGRNFYFVCTCSEGFYIATSKRGMIKGIRFYRAKGGKYKFLSSMIHAYKVKVQEMLNSKIIEEKTPYDDNNQYELKLVV